MSQVKENIKNGGAARVVRDPAGAADVARLAGVSVVTVSRAFNASPLVNQATRERVLAAARELGYRPNSAARALSKGRTNSLGVVLTARNLTGGFHAELLGGFYSAVHAREMSVSLSIAPESDTGQWLRHLVGGAGLDGVVLHHSVVRGAGADLVSGLHVPVVVAGLFPTSEADALHLNYVGFDHVDGVAQAIRHLLALGHRRIAYFDSYEFNFGITAREAAFRREMAEAGLEVREDWVIDCTAPDETRSGAEAIHRVLGRRPPHPTAVVCASDMLAAGVVTGAKAWGRRVPEDLSVTGYGDLPWTAIFSPALTSVHQRGWDLGKTLGEKLVALCEGRDDGCRWIPLSLHLTVRESTGPCCEVKAENGLT